MKTIIIHADLDNILFENRNKAYGAYEIRKNYNRRLEISFLITAITTLTLCLFFYMYPPAELHLSRFPVAG